MALILTKKKLVWNISYMLLIKRKVFLTNILCVYSFATNVLYCFCILKKIQTIHTGFEPVISCVTGKRLNPSTNGSYKNVVFIMRIVSSLSSKHLK